MSDEKKEPSVRELFEIVRRGMVFRGKALPQKIDRFESARLWLEEENITVGIFCVRSSVMHDYYVKWCEGRGLTGKAILSMNKLGEFLTSQFQPLTHSNKTTSYFISKELIEDEEQKAKRKEKYSKKPNDKGKKGKTKEKMGT